MAVSTTTVLHTATTATTNGPERRSVPAVRAWSVLSAKSAKLAKWTRRQILFGIRARASEVSSTAAKR